MSSTSPSVCDLAVARASDNAVELLFGTREPDGNGASAPAVVASVAVSPRLAAHLRQRLAELIAEQDRAK